MTDRQQQNQADCLSIVPTIDLARAEQDASLLAPLDLACRDHGFFLLRNHGMDAAIDRMWSASRAFFAQSTDEKREVMRTADSPLGYYDRELTKRKRDLKEVFDYMRSREDGSDVNQWPAGQNEFRAALTEFFDASSLVAARTLAIVYRALLKGGVQHADLPPGDPRTSTVRLNFYPLSDPLDDHERSNVVGLGDMALHHHTDPGVLTLLLQDMTGGLQTLSNQGWIDVTPQPGTIVVNLGDALQVWTNDTYKAAVHRVVPLTREARYSTPYFYNPASQAILQPLAALGQGEPLYRRFTWREYIKGRVDDNYNDIGEDDIQIAKFRI